MCGIAVAIDWPEAEATVGRLIGGILHRGDVTDPIAVLRKDTAMATRRLRIVDAEHAIQPQVSFNSPCGYLFNGEIYNYLELRRELQRPRRRIQNRIRYRSSGQRAASVGYRALERTVGMYAFVAVDLANGEFRSARPVRGQAALHHSNPARGICSARRCGRC